MIYDFLRLDHFSTMFSIEITIAMILLVLATIPTILVVKNY